MESTTDFKRFVLGQKIVLIRDMTEEELGHQGWEGLHPGSVLVLKNGTRIFASRDEEGNGPGSVFGYNSDGNDFQI